MQTTFTTSPAKAAEFIKGGGLVAFPTETVYGLGADIFDEIAIAKIFEAKNRPADNPLIAHIADLRQILKLSDSINRNAQKFIDAFFPGPLTIVLQKAERVPRLATAGLDTIGIRMPRFELAHQFLSACETPVAAPSANLSGRPSPTTWEAVAEDLDGRIDCIFQSEATEIGLESTVVDCTAATPLVLRSGSVSIEQLRSATALAQRQGLCACAQYLIGQWQEQQRAGTFIDTRRQQPALASRGATNTAPALIIPIRE